MTPPSPVTSWSHSRRVAVAAACTGALTLTLAGCITVNVPPTSTSDSGTSRQSSQPSATQQLGDSDFPAAGIPTQVKWPSDWLEGFMGESEGVRGTIVSIDLDYERGQWIWEVTSRDPGPNAEHPTRGFEADLAAETLEVLSSREVQLDPEEQTKVTIGIAEAARLSGESSPSPRLVELAQDEDRGVAVWEATLVDTETWAETELTIDANTGDILTQETD
ncbi:putative membrane protein YkoI [Leucobacter luti]|uniref:PepSY domain-containing protein n=1 Tax=Leucobacter luti TaxID=340320 RepID=UPI00104858A9|nr:PepSY domain-containing protein [Leucobacter luti]MCW2289655.1 putative membrane protein YkoI [Leucobacter luti]TCK37826.1 putative membrane protein YkoI [Leucobacter luti]